MGIGASPAGHARSRPACRLLGRKRRSDGRCESLFRGPELEVVLPGLVERHPICSPRFVRMAALKAVVLPPADRANEEGPRWPLVKRLVFAAKTVESHHQAKPGCSRHPPGTGVRHY